MPIILSGNTILYTPIDNNSRWLSTGVIEDDNFAICDTVNVLKQIQFNINPVTTGQGTLTIQCDISGDQIINLATLSTGNAFGLIQTDSGTFPTADTLSDTLFIIGDGIFTTVAGDSSIDTVSINTLYTPEDLANKSTDFTTLNNTLYPTTLAVSNFLGTYLSGNNIFMFSDTASDITGYESAPELSVYTAGGLATKNTTVTTSETLLEEFATDLGYPSTNAIPVGVVTFHYETEKVSGSNNYRTRAKLYKRDSLGTETLLLTSDNSTETSSNTAVQQTVTALNSSIIYLDLTDRLVCKVYAEMLSSSATIILKYDDTTDARFTIPTTGVGPNTTDVTLAAIGSSPNANAATLTGQVLNLEPASASFGGVVTTGTQTFAGAKTFNGVVAHTLASAALPAIVPTGDVDTGIWSSGANSWSISTTGVERLRIGVSNSGFLNFGGNFTATNAGFTINSIASNVVTACLRLANGQSVNQLELYTYAGASYASWDKDGYLHLPLGSASAPFLTPFGDTNSGLFSSGADAISVSTNSSERIRFQSGGYVNIGANYTDTSATLQVSSIGTTTVTQRIKAITSQTSDLFQATNSSSTPLVGITASGQFYAGTNGIPTANTSHSFTSISDGNTTLGLKVRSSGTQTADLISIFNSAYTEIAQLNVEAYWYLPAGLIDAPSYTFYGDAKYGMYHPSSETRLVSEEKYLGVTKNGNIKVICHENAEAIGDSTKQEIRSGESFTPTFNNLTDITISVESINWFRIGNEVTVSVYGKATTSSYNYSFEMDLPVSSDFTNDFKAGGIGVIQLPDKEESTFSICAEVSNNTVYCQGYDVNGGGLSDAKFNMHFTYTVEG